MGFVGVAQAVHFEHTTNGLLGRDTFESQPPGDIPNGGGALPTVAPGPGSWTSDIAGNATGRVTSAVSPGPADSGSQYIQMEKSGLTGQGNRMSLAIDFANDIDPSEEGVITCRWSIYVDSQGAGLNEQSVGVGLKVNTNGTGADLGYAHFHEDGELRVGGTGTGGAPGGQQVFPGAFPVDTWISVELKYTVVTGSANDSFSVTIWDPAQFLPIFSVSGVTETGDNGSRPIRSAVYFAGNFSDSYFDSFVDPGGPPDVVSSSNIVVEATAGIGYDSDAGATHRLQSTPDLVSSNFTDTGAFAFGDGGPQILFDPTGTVTTKNYRVVK
jgi:hypothetical protein